MSETPSVNTVGYTVAEAVKKAAAQLNVEPMLVRWELDTSHFRNEEGRRVPRDTVAIIATALDASAVDGANACRDWVAGLLERMEVEATVTSKLDGDKRVTISIDSPRARHLVGRRGDPAGHRAAHGGDPRPHRARGLAVPPRHPGRPGPRRAGRPR